MKKVILILAMGLFWYNLAYSYDFPKILISCASTNFNTRYLNNKDKVDYSELKPSHFTGIIEIIGDGKIIGRLTGSSETGNLKSPYFGTINDTKIIMTHKKKSLDEKGTIFELNLISGMFEHNSYLDIEGMDDWYLQRTGVCDIKT